MHTCDGVYMFFKEPKQASTWNHSFITLYTTDTDTYESSVHHLWWSCRKVVYLATALKQNCITQFFKVLGKVITDWPHDVETSSLYLRKALCSFCGWWKVFMSLAGCYCMCCRINVGLNRRLKTISMMVLCDRQKFIIVWNLFTVLFGSTDVMSQNSTEQLEW